MVFTYILLLLKSNPINQNKIMKTLRNTLLFLLLSAGYTYAQNIIVQGEKKLNIDLAKYKTFGWMDSDKQNPHLSALWGDRQVSPGCRQRSEISLSLWAAMRPTSFAQLPLRLPELSV